jgi:hypothetical protein
VSREKHPVSAVIEPVFRQPSGRRRPIVSPREAFFYNANPHRIIEDFPREKWGSVLREIERQHRSWSESRSDEQGEWVLRRSRPDPVGTLAAARLIVQARET